MMASMVVRPERYTHCYKVEFSSAIQRRDGYGPLGPGERIVFEPYTREAYEEAPTSIAGQGIFASSAIGPLLRGHDL